MANLNILPFSKGDIDLLVNSFARHNWLEYGQSLIVDDDLVMWLTRRIGS